MFGMRFMFFVSASDSGWAAGSAELGGCDWERSGPAVPFPRDVPVQRRTRVGEVSAICFWSWELQNNHTLFLVFSVAFQSFHSFPGLAFTVKGLFNRTANSLVTCLSFFFFLFVIKCITLVKGDWNLWLCERWLWCVCVCRQRGLFRVLKAYTQYQPDEGYCQAQGPVAAVLLMNMPAQVKAINSLASVW